MSGVFEKYINAHETNIKVFNMIQHTITGWPGGNHFLMIQIDLKEQGHPKRVLIFSIILTTMSFLWVEHLKD